MGPKDIRSTTWYLNQVMLRIGDHFPVFTRIEGRDLKTKKRVKGWAWWTPVSEAVMLSSKNLCSVHEVTMAKPLHVMLRRERDWSFYMIGW